MTKPTQAALTAFAVIPCAVAAMLVLATVLTILWPFIVIAVYTYEKRKVLATPTLGVYLNSRKV